MTSMGPESRKRLRRNKKRIFSQISNGSQFNKAELVRQNSEKKREFAEADRIRGATAKRLPFAIIQKQQYLMSSQVKRS